MIRLASGWPIASDLRYPKVRSATGLNSCDHAVRPSIANAVPRVVLGSIFIIALGLGMPSKVALAVVMVFFVVFGNAFLGVREADRAMIANAMILGASPWRAS